MQADNEHVQTGSETDSGDADAIRILSDVESRLHALKAMHENYRVKEAEIAQREERVAESTRQFTEAQERFEHERARLQEQAAETATLQSEIAREQEALAQQRRQIESRAQQASDDLEAAHQLGQELAEKEQRQARSDEQSADFERALHEQVARAEEAQKLAAERGEELLRIQEQISAASNDAESVRQQLQETGKRESELQDKIVSLEEQLSGTASTQTTLDETKQRLSQAHEQIESSRGDAEQIRSLESDLDRAVDGLAQLKARYESGLSESTKNNESLRAELDAAAEGSQSARDRLSEMERNQAETRVHWGRRRTRLASMRSAVQTQRGQVARAIVKLKERQVECERVLKQRSDVERARKELRSKRRQADQLIKRYKGAKFVMFLMGAATLMMGMSWGIASHFVQATYQASATLAAENKDRDLESYELDEWQAYHEPMLADPQFHAMAAERFRRRGISSLGKPAEIAQFVNSNVHHRSNRSGELIIELTGVGQERTELLLNTLVTAARSYAEAGRAQRTDGAATIISQDAAVADRPLHDPRPLYAGGVFMGGLLLMFGLGVPAWRRLRTASSEFDEQEKANAVGAESDWIEPELLQKKP